MSTPSSEYIPRANPAAEARLDVVLVRVVLLAIGVVGIVVERGFHGTLIPAFAIHLCQVGLILAVALDRWFGAHRGRMPIRGEQPDIADGVFVAVGLGGALVSLSGLARTWWMAEAALLLMLLFELWRLNVILARWFHRPGLMLPLSFLLLIVVGTPLLMLPLAVPPGQRIGWLDALFTATSAVCVTGLTLRDTATQFTPFGQAVIACLIQLGGLGIIVFGSVFAMLLGSKPSLREDLSLSSMLQDQPLLRVSAYVRFVVLATLLIEAVGAVLLVLTRHSDDPVGPRIAWGVFHSISAFCNAGFTLQSDSFESYRHTYLLQVVVAGLIVVGGLGFPVLVNLWRAAFASRRDRGGGFAAVQRVRGAGRPAVLSGVRLTLQSKIVLTTTATLYVYGVIGITAGQLRPSVDAYFQQGVTANRVAPAAFDVSTLGAVLSDAGFMSITARTAGFNAIPMDDLSPAARFVVLTQMMVGASPGSTGGGMKTTTLALLVLSIAATIRHRDRTEAFGRAISDALVRKAGTIAACFVALCCLATLLLSLSEPYPFGKIAFEAVSAASTTGLSLGITGDLTGFGRCVLIGTMFAGRVGPLALLAVTAIGSRPARPYTYPEETVVLG